jgi:glyoxylase-like metal-dependent hydrolase (beta-lactamase superfamily II)
MEGNYMTIRHTCFAMAAMAATAAFALAQGQPDFSKVEIKATKLADNFYTLEGQGGTIGVLTGPQGVFMVDSQFAPLSGKIAAKIKEISGGEPIKFMINTHVHGDHTGGDENFGKMGVTIISRPELRNRLAHPNAGPNGQPGTPMPAAGLPLLTYAGTLTFNMDGEEVHVYAIPRAHTDGDTIVQFVNDDIIMTGDFYRSIQFPNIDRANGGSLRGLEDGLSRVIALSGPNTRIVPGPGPMVDRNAVMAHRDVVIAVQKKVADLIKQGKSQEEVIAAKPAAEFASKIKDAGTTEDRFVGQVYAELKAN